MKLPLSLNDQLPKRVNAVTPVTKEIEEGKHILQRCLLLRADSRKVGANAFMGTNARFPFFRWIVRTATGRWARRAYAAIILLMLLLTTTVHLRSYLMARKIQAVLHGLAQIRVDQTTEEQLTKMVPYLTQRDWKVDGIPHRRFFVQISNESDRLPRVFAVALSAAQSDQLVLWLEHLLGWLGYRFMSFDASVLVQDRKVSQVEYGLANQWVRPQYPAYVGYIVSARSEQTRFAQSCLLPIGRTRDAVHR